MKNFFKKVVIVLMFIMGITVCFAFGGCETNEKTIQEQFADYLGIDSQYGEIKLNSGIEAPLFYFEKEDNYTNRVWLKLEYMAADKDLYSWLNLSVEEKKKDLKAVGDKVVAFAKENKWSNNYYLYISFGYDLDVETIYDYEKDKLYIPQCDNLFIEMYEKFNTCNNYKVKDMRGGADWLVSRGIGEYKHGEYQKFYSIKSPLVSMTIWCKDGKFSIRNVSKSTAY